MSEGALAKDPLVAGNGDGHGDNGGDCVSGVGGSPFAGVEANTANTAERGQEEATVMGAVAVRSDGSRDGNNSPNSPSSPSAMVTVVTPVSSGESLPAAAEGGKNAIDGKEKENEITATAAAAAAAAESSSISLSLLDMSRLKRSIFGKAAVAAPEAGAGASSGQEQQQQQREVSPSSSTTTNSTDAASASAVVVPGLADGSVAAGDVSGFSSVEAAAPESTSLEAGTEGGAGNVSAKEAGAVVARATDAGLDGFGQELPPAEVAVGAGSDDEGEGGVATATEKVSSSPSSAVFDFSSRFKMSIGMFGGGSKSGQSKGTSAAVGSGSSSPAGSSAGGGEAVKKPPTALTLSSSSSAGSRKISSYARRAGSFLGKRRGHVVKSTLARER